MSAIITVDFCVPAGYLPGDYCRLFSNGGSGAVDYETPVVPDVFELFPRGAGIYGFGLAPFGSFRFGSAHSMRTAGFGNLPFGRFPFGLGAVWVRAKSQVDSCGQYKFAFKAYDAAGNAGAGSPEEVSVDVHIAPPQPSGLVKVSYDKVTDILVLEAA